MDLQNDCEMLDLCKENIQPLRKGRNASQLGLALQAEVNTDLQEKIANTRQEFEMAIINYEGPDPLQPRIDYINWMEQTLIKHGRDCNLVPLLEDTITQLKDNEEYKQDPRFIDFIVKYIETQENSAELFQMVYSQGLGTMCSVLYIGWAEALELASDFKRADQVYYLGIANRAQPLEILQDKHREFQLTVSRRLANGELSPAKSDEPASRQVLGKLKKGTSSVRSYQGAAGILTIKENKKSSGNVALFHDREQNYEHLISTAMQKNKLASIATAEKNNEENTIKAGTWNKAYNRREVSRLPPVPSTPSVEVYADPESEIETPKIISKTPYNVLKARKADLGTKPMDVLSSASRSTHKPLQANLELFSGGLEFSFEELRAAYYRKKNVNGYLRTPSKHTDDVSSHHTTELTFETPVNKNLTISRNINKPNVVRGSELFDNNDSPFIEVNNEFPLQTPLKQFGFVPLTPSVSDRVDFIETPVQKKAPLYKPTAIGLNIYSDDDIIDKPVTIQSVKKNDMLPTINENPDESDLRIIKNNAISRKKQLFSEAPLADKPVKSTSAFTIFVDED